LLGLLITFGVTMIGPLFIRFFYSPEFWEAGSILIIHIWASVFIFMRSVLSKWLIITANIKFSMHTHIIGALVNVALNFVVIPKYGIMGAAISTLISYAFSSFFVLLFYRKLRPFAKLMVNSVVHPINGIKYILKND